MAEAKAKTAAFYASVASMSTKGANIVMQIRVKGEATGDPAVWEQAMIPAPAIPSPIAPPGKPTNFVANLQPNGALELVWKCANPKGSTGIIYHVYRRVSEQDEWKFVGGSGAKLLVDTTVPAGVPRLYYTIQAARSTAIGVEAEFIVNFGVNFGVNAGGSMTATVSHAQSAASPKLAA